MTNTGLLKTQAKKLLNGNWGVLVGAFLAVCIIFCVTLSFTELLYRILGTINANGYVTGINQFTLILVNIATIALVLLCSPIILGYLRMCYHATKGIKVSFSEIGHYFVSYEKYRRGLSFCFLFFLKFFWLQLLFFIPATLLQNYNAISYDHSNLFLTVLTIVFQFLGLCALIAVILKYFYAPFLFFEDEEINFSHCFAMSKYLYKYRKGSLGKLLLSFFPWYLSLFFILPAFYFIPYELVTICNAIKWELYNFKSNPLTNTN